MASTKTVTTAATYEICEGKPTQSEAEQLAREVAEGLAASPKRLCSRFFYDERGSALFQQITEQSEYYPTGCETEILQRHRGELAALLDDDDWRVVELGVGDGQKIRPLIDDILARGRTFEFVPIDICHETIAEVVKQIGDEFADHRLSVHGIVGEYGDALRMLHRRDARRQLVLFLGSSIGNMTDADARSFLAELRASLDADDLALIGFDLKKDPRLLQAAYDDAVGVTAEFNLNLLDRLNRELGASFDRSLFRHHAFYNPELGRMESWLLSTESQTVAFDMIDEEFHFAAWEGMHLECSHKYTPAMIESLADEAGFTVDRHLYDSRGWFVDSVWRAA